MQNTMRTKEMVATYDAYRAAGGDHGVPCVLCARDPLTTFTYWKIIKNHFPYDVIAEKHNMLVPLRHTKESEFTEEEIKEFRAIKAGSLSEYDYLIEGVDRVKSIPAHFHLHLIVGKGPQ